MAEEYLGYFKYEGKKVADGYMDLRKSADVLTGIDEIFRYFLYKTDPELNKIEFEIPVKIRKGSWEALIPENIGDWIELALGAGGTTYLVSLLKKMAQNDIGDKGFKDLFKGFIKSIKWIIKIGKHTGTLKTKSFDSTKFLDKEGIQFIGIENSDGLILYVPKTYLDIYSQVPSTLLTRLIKIIDIEREFKVGLNEKEANDLDDTDREISINYNERNFFIKDNEDDEILFPELKHGQYIELEGHITRGNENSNNLGFEYKKHILTCYPQHGNVVSDSKYIFMDCIIKGYIDRQDKTGVIEKRPKIRYLEILPNTKDSNLNLFNK